MPQFDSSSFISQLFWFAICFAILYYFMSMVYLPRIREILKERNKKIENDRSIAEELQEKIRDLKKHSNELRGTSSSNYKIALEQASKQTILNREEALNSLKKKLDQINVDAEKSLANFVRNQENSCMDAAQKLAEIINSKLLEGNLEKISVKMETKN
jgi:F-type H+-transporting ATPase subunit b